MSNFISEVRRVAKRALIAGAEASGYELVQRHYYSPLPDLDSLPPGLWDGPKSVPGVNFRLDSAVRLLQDDLSPLIAEFEVSSDGGGSGFNLENGTYGSVDAETLYAMTRHLGPRNVVELGSGASSHVIAQAASSASTPFIHTVFDPYPFTASPMGAVAGAKITRVGSEFVNPQDLSMLSAGDILFIDTTHTVKTGGDCQNIILNLLPSLPTGVYIHVHDIFLPYEYPRHWVLAERRAWAEQYLLQAFLAFNDEFEVVLPCNALAREHPAVVSAAVPSFKTTCVPGAFWFRRT